MITATGLENTLRQIELKRERLKLTNDDMRFSLDCHLNTFMNWKASGFKKMTVSDLLSVLSFLSDVEERGKDVVISEIHATRSELKKAAIAPGDPIAEEFPNDVNQKLVASFGFSI